MAEWIKRHNSIIFCLVETPIKLKKFVDWKDENRYAEFNLKKKATVTILISDHLDFRAKKIGRDKERYYITEDSPPDSPTCAFTNIRLKTHEVKTDRAETNLQS